VRRVAPVAKPHSTATSLPDDARFTARVQKLVPVCPLQRFGFNVVPNSRFDRRQAMTVAPSSGARRVGPPDGVVEGVPVTGGMHQMATLD